ncbi:hypothetical protein ACFU44_06035 [Nocardia rhizosphaerihabitans]|uniref:hypothetical protein n=1 Tax=Nocardia rhizosphaerihabitans TaxID=1691570 RepID=UPI00366E6550
MSWVNQGTRYTDPDYYRDSATPIEAQLRADFATCHQLRELAAYGETPAHIVEYAARAHNIARSWQHESTPEHRALWQQLSAAAESWTSNPETARIEFSLLQQAFIEGDSGIEPDTIRTQRQAAEITGHLEPVHDHSTQDEARWRPRHLALVRDHGTESSLQRIGAADRALGGRAAEELSLAEIEQIIDATDEQLGAEEAVGDLDRGTDELDALIPPGQRSAPVRYDYTAAHDQYKTHIQALRRVQDLTAEHLRLASQFDGTPEGGQALIDRLETLIDATRRARLEAVNAGVDEHDITAAYRAGLGGHYWSQQPGVPHLGQLDQLLGDHEPGLTEIGVLRTEPGAEAAQAPELALAAGAEFAHPPSASTSIHPAGAVISSAVEAALPDGGGGAGWSSPELTGVIDAPHRDIGADPHF